MYDLIYYLIAFIIGGIVGALIEKSNYTPIGGKNVPENEKEMVAKRENKEENNSENENT